MDNLNSLLVKKIKLENNYLKYLVENNDQLIKKYSKLLDQLDTKLSDLNYISEPLIFSSAENKHTGESKGLTCPPQQKITNCSFSLVSNIQKTSLKGGLDVKF